MPYNSGMAVSTVENILEVSTDEIRQLRKAVKDNNLNDRFKAVIFTMIDEIVEAKQTEKEKQACLKRIKRMFSSSTEKQQKVKAPTESEKPSKNHGHYSTNDYQFSRIVAYPSVAKNPHLWLPWNYKNMLAGSSISKTQANAPP